MRLAALLLIPLLAGAAAAQTTEKETVAAVKAAAKAQLKVFKASGKAALGSLDAGLKAIEVGLTDASPVEDTVSAVAAEAVEFLDNLREAYAMAADEVNTAAAVALTALADGGDLAGLYPEDLYYGTGGALDRFQSDLLKAATKLADGARKRLAKSAQLAEKQADIALAFQLYFPVIRKDSALNSVGHSGVSHEPRVDLALGGSRLGVASDGVLVVAGISSLAGTDADLFYFGPPGSSGDSSFNVSNDGRFVGTFGDDLAEGGYLVWALQGSGVQDDSAAVGIR